MTNPFGIKPAFYLFSKVLIISHSLYASTFPRLLNNFQVCEFSRPRVDLYFRRSGDPQAIHRYEENGYESLREGLEQH